MNTIPIVFAFDNNLILPACVCISSLMINAKEDTFYDIFILYSEKEALKREQLDKLPRYFPQCRLQYRAVDNTFDKAFEIRGITTPAYYRLLIPELVPEYDKILYSDVDVVFRSDLADFYLCNDLQDYYVAGVNSLSHLVSEYKAYFDKMGMDASQIIYSGNLLINSRKMKEDGLIQRFKAISGNKYKFQDMDILNIVCKGKIKYLDPYFCLTTLISELAVYDCDKLRAFWSDTSISRALSEGIVHYNGQKPWKQYCVNFDIWWEYYRKSPFFDGKFYFDFFFTHMYLIENLSLWKRIKILVQYFIK